MPALSFDLVEELPSPEQYRSFRERFGWTDISVNAITKGLETSLYSVCAKIENQIIGCARVVGDGGVYFYLQDVMVDPAFQNQGIGRALTAKCMDYIASVAPTGAFIGLMAAKDKASLYEPFGFEKRADDRPGKGFYVKDRNDS
jgi:ribosomal protein S18 acetylase RimI-like enzyme